MDIVDMAHLAHREKRKSLEVGSPPGPAGIFGSSPASSPWTSAISREGVDMPAPMSRPSDPGTGTNYGLLMSSSVPARGADMMQSLNPSDSLDRRSSLERWSQSFLRGSKRYSGFN